MRTLRRCAAVLLAAALVPAGLTVVSEVRDTGARPEKAVLPSGPPAPAPPVAAAPDHDLGGRQAPEHLSQRERERERERTRANCRTRVEGSRATADCHNPNPATDRVRLHVECARWWDLDTDSAPAEIPPAGYVRLSDRCWKEVRTVWVTHERVD